MQVQLLLQRPKKVKTYQMLKTYQELNLMQGFNQESIVLKICNIVGQYGTYKGCKIEILLGLHLEPWDRKLEGDTSNPVDMCTNLCQINRDITQY